MTALHLLLEFNAFNFNTSFLNRMGKLLQLAKALHTLLKEVADHESWPLRCLDISLRFGNEVLLRISFSLMMVFKNIKIMSVVFGTVGSS